MNTTGRAVERATELDKEVTRSRASTAERAADRITKLDKGLQDIE